MKTRHWTLCLAVAVCFLQSSYSSAIADEVIFSSDSVIELQPGCSFNCTSGECLEEEKVCDGKMDCADMSDETSATCLNRTSLCPAYVFICDYGACVDADARCNGKLDCVDASDEKNCEISDNSTCQFQCKSGECIEFHELCDGSIDCSDKSDETKEACSERSVCPGYALRCDYGGCVDSGSRCDGKMDCVDGSDEKNCPMQIQKCRDGKFQCDNGLCVSGTDLCDGKQDCSDGSDETRKQCENFMCPSYAFRCDYGACIDGDDACDGKPHCADGSDENESVCAVTTPKHIPCPPLKQPAHSKMDVLGSIAQFSCKPGYSMTGLDTIQCHKGQWLSQPPSCISGGMPFPGSGSTSSTPTVVDWKKITLLLFISLLAPWA